MKTKICRICQEERKISKFQKREDGKLRNECNLCFNSYQRDRYALIHGNRLEVRRESREADPKCCIKCGEEKSLDEFGFPIGITPDDYKKMLEGQNGKCAICGAIESHSKGHRLAVDHDHETGKIRGLLCHNCNVGLGNFKDSPDLIRSAIEYLK